MRRIQLRTLSRFSLDIFKAVAKPDFPGARQQETTPMTEKQVVAPVFVPMSLDQPGRAADRFLTKCRKDGGILPHDFVQSVLEEEGDELAEEMFNVLRARVERRAKMIVRKVRVDRTRTLAEALKATGRPLHVDPDVLTTAQKGKSEEVDVWFFYLEYDPTPTELAKEYELRKLAPDLAAQAAVNEADPAFADERPNGLQWGLDNKGWASFAAFDRWDDGRVVVVSQGVSRWDRYVRFGGVRK